MSEWNLETREVTVAELDEAVIQYKLAKEEHEKASAVSSEKHEEAEKCKNNLIALLECAGKTSYILENVALITVSLKTQVTTPKTIEDKEKFFAWVEKKLGREGMIAYQTVNYQSLNSLYNSAMKEALDKGQEWNGVDGIDMPTVVRTLSMRAR